MIQWGKSLHGFAQVVTVIAAAALCWGVFNSQPRTGTVTGVCRSDDPLSTVDDLTVDLTPVESEEGSSSEADDPTSHVENAVGDTAAPFGWSQGSANDGTAEENRRPKHGYWEGNSIQVHTDADGKFVFKAVPVGKYTIHCDGMDYSDNPKVTVTEEGVSDFTLKILGVSSSLSFKSSVTTWLPSENPVYGLSGLLRNRRVGLTLERLNIDSAAARQPGMLLNHGYIGGNKSSSWPGEFTPYKKWAVDIPRSNDEDSFYQRIPLGKLPEGVYHLTAESSEANSDTWIQVTRLGMIRKSYGNHALVYVCDLKTGVPQAGVPVTLYGEYEKSRPVVGQTVSNAEGIGQLTAFRPPRESGILIARIGDSVAGIPMELNSPGESGSSGEDSDASTALGYSSGVLRSFIYTDRPIYRPGQTINFKGIARWFERNAKLRSPFVVPNNQSVLIDIKDAQDTVVSHQELRTNDMGSWNGSLTLSTEALTGEYSIHMTLGGQTAEGSFVVAAYHKPEYQVKVVFDKERYVRGDTIQATVTASYYFGAPLASATLRYSVRKEEGSDYDDYYRRQQNSNSPNPDSYGEPIRDQEVRLDAMGQAHISVPTTVGSEDVGDQTYTFDADVTDASRNNVSATASAIVGQGEFSLAVKPSFYNCQPGEKVTVAVSATGVSVKPVPNQQIVVVTQYQSWEDGEERLTHTQKVSATTDTDGNAIVTVTPDRSGLFLIAAHAIDRRGNKIAAEKSVWVTDQFTDIAAEYADLSVVLDKQSYDVGSTAHILINSQYVGPTALVTVEGATLYQSWTVPLRRHSTAFDIPVDIAYAPGVTISVCALHEKQMLQSSADLLVDDNRRKLKIAVTGDGKLYHPGDPATITIHTTDGLGHPQSAEVSVGVVDSSIYAIREDPDETIDNILTPDQGNIVSTEYSSSNFYLGDVDKGDVDVKLRHKFPDTALWNPTIRTDANGTAVVPMTMPDTLTTWRVTCVGHTLDSAVGKGTCNLVVNKDLIARLETPRFLTVGDTSQLIGVVNNNTATPMTTVLRLHGDILTVNGPTQQTVVAQPGIAVKAVWSVRADKTGSAAVSLTAMDTSGSRSDGVTETVPVQPHGTTRKLWQTGSLVNMAERVFTPDPSAVPGSAVVTVRLTPTMSASLLPALDYLGGYPYGTTDSTSDILRTDSLIYDAAGGTTPVFAMTDVRRARLKEQIERGLLRLYRFQNDEGGWAWWNYGKPELWMTTDAVLGIEDAKDAGFPVNTVLLKAGVAAAVKLSKEERDSPKYSFDNPSSLVFAALAFARAGNSVDAGLNLKEASRRWTLHPERRTYSDLAVAAMAYKVLGDASSLAQANSLMTEIWEGRYQMGSVTAWPYSPHEKAEGVDQSTPDAETTAWVMLATETITPADSRVDAVASWLMANRSGDHWAGCFPSTTTAIAALTPYLRRSHERRPNFDATLSINGKSIRQIHFGPESIDRPDVSIVVPQNELTAGKNVIRLQKKGEGRLYYSMELSQNISIPRPTPPPTFWHAVYTRFQHPERSLAPFSPSGYHIKRVYLRNTSRRNFLWEDTVPAPGTDFNAEDDVLVRLIIDCTRPGSHLIVEEPLPAGCTVSDISRDEAEEWSEWWDYTDIRDDRIAFFISDMTRGRHEIDYHLRASTPGVYDVMPTLLTGTFDPTLHALGGVGRVTIAEGDRP